MATTTTRIGIDVGFGDTKAVFISSQGPQALTFPSVLGRAEDRARVAVGLGGRRAYLQEIGYNGRTYFIGDGAIIESRLGGDTRQDAGRIGSEAERVLLLAALARANVEQALIVTGLPVLWWDRRSDLAKSWIGEHHLTVDGRARSITVLEVRPVWQPLGSFYARFLGDDGAATAPEPLLRAGFGVVDVGFNTTDLSGLHNLQPVAQWSGGVGIGVRHALESLATHIEAQYGVRRPLAELAQALRKGQPLQVYRDTIPLDGLVSSSLTFLAEQIVSEASRQWGQADRFHTVLITGGGAALMGKEIAAAFSHNAEVLPAPAMANALGFARFAQRRIFKADRG